MKKHELTTELIAQIAEKVRAGGSPVPAAATCNIPPSLFYTMAERPGACPCWSYPRGGG